MIWRQKRIIIQILKRQKNLWKERVFFSGDRDRYSSWIYAGTPVLDKERVSDCKKVVSVPLVLHGASGLSEEDVVECVQRGMCKVNFATELRVAYTDAEKQLLKENPETFDPKKLGIAAMKAVKEQTILRMKMCGCTGKVQ